MESKETMINKLVEDGDFLEAMKKAESKDDIKAVFSQFGLELSNEEIDGFTKMIEKDLAGEELGDEELETVSGGVSRLQVLTWMYKGAKAVAKICFKAGQKFADWERKLYK